MAIGTLTIEMAANVARLQSDMKRAVDTVDSAMSQVRKAAGLAAGALAALGVGMSLSAINGFIRRSIDAADAMAKLSQKTGVAVRDIAGLQLAYRQSGLGADVFETSMARLSRSMESNNKAFAAMGISVRNADGQLRPMKDVLGEVADKFGGVRDAQGNVIKGMEGYADGAAKAAIAQELFGRSGAAMIPLLNSSAKGLKDMDEWARKLGLTVEEETAKQAEQFNDTLDLMGQGMAGVGRQIAAQMLPTLTTLAGELLQTATDFGVLRGAASVLGVTFKGLYSVVAVGIGIFKVLGNSITSVAAALMLAAKGQFQAAWEALKTGGQDIAANVRSVVDSLSNVWTGAGDSAVEAMAVARGAAKRAAPDMEAPGKSAAKSMRAAKDEAMELYQKLTMKDVGLDPKFYADLNKLHGLYTSGRIGIEQYRGAVEKLIGQQQFAKDLAREEADALKKLADAQKALSDARKREAAEYDRALQSIKDGNAQLRLEIDTLGMSRRERTAYNQALNQASIAKLQDKLATLQLFGAEEELLQAVRDQIAALEDRNALMGRVDDAQDMQEALQQQVSTWQSIERTAHDVFVNIFEDGAGTFKRLGQTLKAALLDWLYQLTVRRWIINIGASLSGSPGGFLQAFGGQGGGGLLGTAQNAGGLMNLFGGVGGNWGALQGLFGGTMSFANAAGSIAANTMAGMGMYGGNSLNAFLATNGAYGTAGSTGLGGLAGAAVLALPFIVGSLVERNSRDRIGGAAFATSDHRNDPYAQVVEGSTAWGAASGGNLPDVAAMRAELEAAGMSQSDIDKLSKNPRTMWWYVEAMRNYDPSQDEFGHGAPRVRDHMLNIPDFYRGQGFADPANLGWWNWKSNDFNSIDPRVIEASRAIAVSVVDPLTNLARAIGDESGFRATAGFANRGKGKMWGNLLIQRGDETVYEMAPEHGHEDFKNVQEYMRAVYRGGMEALAQLDLPEWAKKQVEGAQAQLDALTGEEMGQEAAALYAQTAAGIAQMYTAIDMLIKVFPDFKDATQDSVHALQELMGGMDGLQGAYSSYIQTYWSEEERMAMMRQQLTLDLERVGLALPESRDAFRALVEAQDLNTEAGREAFAALMGVAGAFAELTQEAQTAFANTQGLADVIRQGLLGELEAEDLGRQMADVVIGGIYNAIASGFANQITQIMMDGVINPTIQAAVTGASVSEVVSQAAIDRMVEDAVRVAEALGAILDDPAFREALGRIQGSISSLAPQIARPEPYYRPQVQAYNDAQREADRQRQEADRAAQEAQREAERIANERKGLLKQLLQLEGNQAALRQMELEQLDPSNRALQQRIWALQDAAEAEAKHAAALKEANDFLKNVTSNIRSFVAGLNTQTSNPAVNYQQAWAAYNTQLAFAQGGDRDALSNITGYASTLAEAIRQSAQTGAEADLLIGRMRGQLMALPERVSAEQLIVNAVEDMKNTLSGVLVQKFDQLDSNVDGLLTFDELQASGMASDDQIRALIARVDANGDGMISRQEATAANVLGVTTAVNTGTTSSEYWSNILNNNNASGFSGVRGRVGDVDNSVQRSNDMFEHGGYTLADYAGLNHVLLSYLRTRFDSAFDSFSTGLTVKSMHRGGEWMTFAHGGVFTNSIVDRPTPFRMGLMGEAGPEAIMPLARTSGGELGVRAILDGGAGVAPLLAEMAALRAEVSALRAEARAQASAQVGMSKRAAVAGERVARVVDDWDRNGQPEQREEVTA